MENIMAKKITGSVILKQSCASTNPSSLIGAFTSQVNVHGYVLYLLLFCSRICSLVLSAERILGSTRDSNTSNITGSTSFSWVCRVLTYWYTKMHICASVHVILNACPQFTERYYLGWNMLKYIETHSVSPCAAVWPPVLWTQRAESVSVILVEGRAPAPTSAPIPDHENPTPRGTAGLWWLSGTVERQGGGWRLHLKAVKHALSSLIMEA